LIQQRIYRSTFEAGHFIDGHPKCGVQHGHSYHLSVAIDSNFSKWYDFADLKSEIDNHVQIQYDHQFLGNVSAEQLATRIAKHLTSIGYAGYLELFETEKFGVALTFGPGNQ
jgi:6-pyruvoyl-tetrahydropterin synthase